MCCKEFLNMALGLTITAEYQASLLRDVFKDLPVTTIFIHGQLTTVQQPKLYKYFNCLPNYEEIMVRSC